VNRRVESVRLPARVGGYTGARHRAISGVGREVDPEWHDAFAADARERDDARDVQRRETIQRHAARLVGEANALAALLKAMKGVDPATRSRARRAAHDLSMVTKELES
jgi:hypothetical protein